MATPAVWAARREPAPSSCWPGWCRRGSCSSWWSTKLPHYVLPLYPAIAILIAGAIDAQHAVAPACAGVGHDLVVRGSHGCGGIAGIVALAVIGRQFGLLVWPLIGGAAVMGFLAWRLYRSRRRRALAAARGRRRGPDRHCDLRA